MNQNRLLMVTTRKAQCNVIVQTIYSNYEFNSHKYFYIGIIKLKKTKIFIQDSNKITIVVRRFRMHKYR